MSRKYFIICLLFSLWTIIQTTLHLLFVIYSYYLSICRKSPTESTTIFFYLTYLYSSDCPTPKIEASNSLDSYVTKIFNSILIDNNPSLDAIVKELLEKIHLFPDHVSASSRTSVFLLCFIILDGTWVISAVALLMGTCFGIKESLSLFFYGPWLVLTICVCLFDAAASVLFGLDISESTNFANWMSFVGITTPSSFDLDSQNPPLLLSATPSIALVCISSRFVIIWISNWVGFILVVKATISVYHETYKNERPPPNRLNLDTSAARIRNWQLFYGAVDTTTSSGSDKSDKDHNSNNQNEESGEFYAYSDVVEGRCLEELRGQLPWSYLREEGGSKGEVRIELEKRRENRLPSDTSTVSGTEL
ncbi:uncharacterized protein LOC103314890 isoform X2 [Tribolium castaneum]|uniref:Uncharacterized protein n=1 Tax=Tribolium castaneum TaxID=7070 RepID=D6WIW5_TRICA|nr:PREDICTED: uncharacterized protein LOC103314890 isoform X1 [Tribolium castaneum]XP_008200313.1 PREDICTED: uncharacterized protein LOC103314890 isoform X2 [Tribolium castaneum]EFA01108.1 hypothetical protein TcasGA2_TC004033 [Tribolium castaneum]|eukprot:XP_008200307.1 PREDICTED: uncharacterized protein LOC103314890 isoform X1 [Tribolium castaneum]